MQKTVVQLFELNIHNALAVSDLPALSAYVSAYEAYINTHMRAISHGMTLETKQDAGN